MIESQFSKDLLLWFDQHGRKNLPWQTPIDAYRVWLSEVMLQQTQVATVIPYFIRFIERFPNLPALADADLDEVLSLWAGLGYYSRGRNLHRAAQIIRDEHGGVVPQDLEALRALPGIGRSTAAAIMAQAYGAQTAILDGNVKRVITRLFAIQGWPGERAIESQLWSKADALMPADRCRDYTQAIMDLGATLCTRSKPACGQCPAQSYCQAYTKDLTAELPTRKPKKLAPVKERTLILFERDNTFWLEKRPPHGIWGGLYSLPEFASKPEALAYAKEAFACVSLATELNFEHTFSHYKLKASVLWLRVSTHKHLREQAGIWHALKNVEAAPALPSPIAKLFDALSAPSLLTES